jgi:hypothetical protein
VTRRLATPSVAVPGAVLLALVIVFAVAVVTRPGPARVAAPGGQSVTVSSVARSCPPAAPGSATSQISMIALPASSSAKTTSAQPAAPATGAATFSGVEAASPAATGATGGSKPLGAKAAKASPAEASSGTKAMRPVTVTAPGTVATVTAPDGDGAVVTATGQMAEGFEAEQTDASGAGVVSCTHPGSDMWFVGTGQADGASQVWLYLMNTGNITASADVTIVTDTGQQNGLTNAISVAPNQFVSENVTPYVRGSQAIALHVQAGTGQVAASVWEGGSGGGAWLPQANAPATNLVIPGLTVASSAAKLFVVVPGSSDAQVNVVAYTPAGASPQFPGAPVDATADATTPVALNSLGASAAGLELASNVPIVAGVLVPGAGIGSFTTAVPPVTEQGVIAGNPASRGVTVGMLLTAPSAAARVRISVISANGTATTPAGDESVTVTPGHTLAVPVSRPGDADGRPFAIVVTPQPGSGPLYAARVVTSGTGGLSAPLSSLLPVPSAMTSITLPPVKNSYYAVLP